MTDVLILRRADAVDARAVADVYLRSRHASVPAIPPSVHDDDDVRHHFATAVLPHVTSWVLDDATAGIVGLLVLHDRWVDHLYLDPGWTGKGHGSRLLDHAQRERPEGLDLWAFQTQHRRPPLLRAARLRGRDHHRRRQRGGRARRALPVAGTLIPVV